MRSRIVYGNLCKICAAWQGAMEKNMGRFVKKSLLFVPLLLILAGCATAEQPKHEPGVEDLNPGDKTVIEVPARQPAAQDGVSEKNI